MVTNENTVKKPNQSGWSVAVFSARERAGELLATINSLVKAAREPSTIDVLINGNPSLAEEITHLAESIALDETQLNLRIWWIPLQNKAHAWNQYVHLIWPGSGPTYFVDGYARVKPDCFGLIAEELATHDDALAVGGIPGMGKTASELRAMVDSSGLYGALFALTTDVMTKLRTRGFRLPIGLYGFDSLFGAVLAFGLDPSRNAWNMKRRVIRHPDIQFLIDKKKWWRYSTIQTQIKRVFNNALRVLVVEATKNFLMQKKRLPEELPRTIEEYILAWAEECPEKAQELLRQRPLCRLALMKLRKPKDWSAAEVAPRLIYTRSSQQAQVTQPEIRLTRDSAMRAS